MTFAYYFLIIVFCVSHSVMLLPKVKQKMHKFISPTKYRLTFNFVSLVLLLAIFYTYSQISRVELFSFKGQNIIGVVLVLLGSYFTYVAFQAYNTSEFLGLTPESENQKLNTTGMNKYVRHPLYSATLLLLIGLLIIEPTQAFVGLSVILVIYLLIGIKLEEQKLIAAFGQEYKDYIKAVPMLIPKFW